jgi:hypothetical protein
MSARPVRGARAGHWLAAAGWLLASAATLAADEAGRAQLEQRIRLTARLIGDAATGQRIAASGPPQAQAHLGESRQHQAHAEKALADGDLGAARREVDEALRHIGLARRLAPDGAARQVAAQQRYEQRLALLDRLLQAWPAAETSATRAAGTTDPDDRSAATAQLGEARRLAADGRFEDANQQLKSAEARLLTGLNRLLHQRTLDYSSRAGTLQEQFIDGLARHEGLIDLVPVALAELRPGPEAQTLVERYADASRVLRQRAVQRQQAGDLPQALTDLHNAVLYAQRALTAAGVALPAPVE